MPNSKIMYAQPHIRTNILTGEQVLVSPQRTKRPWQGKQEEPSEKKSATYEESCYLCPGNTRANGGVNPHYESTYSFVNDYAALSPDPARHIFSEDDEHLIARPERGICKVVCFSPDHSLTLADMETEAIEKVVQLWINEYVELSRVDFIRNIQVFENKGAVMGCSNPHPHGQIWAQENVPLIIKTKTDRFDSYCGKKGRTLLEGYLEKELSIGQRILFSNASFAVLVPFWAVWPYEAMIVPVHPQKSIMEMSRNDQSLFAEAISKLTRAYDQLFNTSFPYSSGIHQAPCDGAANRGWHWHMSFKPPLLRSASVKKFMVGYEMFGMAQRDITPEQAAGTLKQLINRL